MRSTSAAGYSSCSLDDLMIAFVRQEDPLRLGMHALSDAITSMAGEIARRELSRHLNLGDPREAQTRDDAWESSMFGLWKMLLKAQSRGDDGFLTDSAQALVRSLAQRALADAFRKQRPESYRLQCQIDYVLERHPLSYGITTSGGMLGRKRLYRVDSGEPGTEPREWDKVEFERSFLHAVGAAEIELPELIRRILLWHGRALTKSEIMGRIKELIPVAPAIINFDESVGEVSAEDHMLRDVEAAIEVGRCMQWLWEELEQLPSEQLQAILWRMDPDGLCALGAQVGFDRMAAVLEIDPVTLAKMATRTPLEFEELAALLGITSQQARSRRQRGWDRIKRRYSAWCRQSGERLEIIDLWMGGLLREPPGMVTQAL